MFKLYRSIQERMCAEAHEVLRKAMQMPCGLERDAALKKARQLGVAAKLDEWLNSPGLQPPSSTTFPICGEPPTNGEE